MKKRKVKKSRRLGTQNLKSEEEEEDEDREPNFTSNNNGKYF